MIKKLNEFILMCWIYEYMRWSIELINLWVRKNQCEVARKLARQLARKGAHNLLTKIHFGKTKYIFKYILQNWCVHKQVIAILVIWNIAKQTRYKLVVAIVVNWYISKHTPYKLVVVMLIIPYYIFYTDY